MTGILNILAGSIAAAIKDGYFNLVTLLLPGNGTNGAQNNTFLDSSTNNFTITRNGNTTQGTFSPFSQTGWGNYFGGSDYLSIANSANLNLGSSNFTIEFWIYAPSATNPYGIISKGNASSISTESWSVEWTNTTGTLGFGSGAFNGWASPIVTGTVTLNAWNHVAVVRNGTTHTLYINGTSASTATASYTVTSSGSLYIGTGWYAPSSRYFTGHISNARIVIGTAVYTSNFTPSTTPLTAITNTQLLTCQSNRFVDNSTNAFAITVTGTPSVQAFSPFAPTAAYDAATVGGSGYFDGTGDYLTLNGGTNLSFGTGDFTVEFWVYLTGGSGNERVIIDFRPTSTDTSPYLAIIVKTTNVISFYAAGFQINGTTTVSLNAWHHVAVARSGTSTKLFLNGTQEGSTYTDSNNYSAGTNRPVIGCQGYTIGSNPIAGYISGIRMQKGTAQYTSAFTPPTAPPTAITNTQLLLNYTNGGIIDATGKNVLETVGNAQISTTQSKFGGSSIYLDGTGSYLQIPDSEFFNLIGDFTIEFWMNPTSAAPATTGRIYSHQQASVGAFFIAQQSSTGFLRNTITNSAGTTLLQQDTTVAPSAGVWTHVAYVRFGNVFTFYINGVANISTTAAITISNMTNAVAIGANISSTPTSFYNGYIDDLRITKGYARYTASFTAPTAAFALQ